MTSSLITAPALGAPSRSLDGAPWPAAATSGASGFSMTEAIVLFVVVAVIALVTVLVLGVRPRRPARRSAHAEKIQRAAAADVAAIEEDDKLVSPDAPGREEDEL